MDNKKVTVSAGSGGIGIGSVCLIVFVICKLAEIAPFASWSWLKVILLPLAISIAVPIAAIALIMLVFLFIVLVGLIASIFK